MDMCLQNRIPSAELINSGRKAAKCANCIATIARDLAPLGNLNFR